MDTETLFLKGIKNGRVYIGPRNVTLKITDVCNYRCPFCWFHSPAVPKCKRTKNLAFNKISEIIRDCNRLKTEKIHISAQGEPFMHPDIYRIITMIKEKGLRLSINTNGSFDYKKIHEVAQVDELQINHSAMSEAVFKNAHNPLKESFSNKMAKLNALIRLKHITKKQKIKIVFMLISKNIHEISQIFDFCKKNELDGLELRLIFASVNMKNLLPDKDSIKKILTGIKRGRDPYISKTNIISLLDLLKDNDLNHFVHVAASSHDQERLLYFKKGFKSDFHCYVGWYNCVINLNGNVYPCCHQESLKAGNVFDNSFKDIWLSTTYRSKRRHMRYNFDISSPFWQRCHNCTYLDFNEQVNAMLTGVPT